MAKDDFDRDILKDWIYAEQRIKTTFDYRLLETQAEAYLARALSSKKLIAVVGSGLTRAYGQPSWWDLLKNTADLIRRTIQQDGDRQDRSDGEPLSKSDQAFIALNNYFIRGQATPASRGSDEDPQVAELAFRYPSLISLMDAFNNARLFDRQKSVKTSEFAVNFEICENLFGEYHLFKLENTHRLYVSRSRELHRARAHLRERLKWQLLDDRGRLEILLCREMATTTEAFTKILKAISYPADLVAQPPNETESLRAALLSLLFFGKLVPEAEADRKRLASAIKNVLAQSRFSRALDAVLVRTPPDLDRANARNTTDNWQVYARKVFNQLTGVDSRSYREISNLIEACFVGLDDAARLAFLETLYDISDRMSQDHEKAREHINRARAIHPVHLDPIAIAVRDLHIKRFLTTNYDSEFEKWLESLGYVEVAAQKNIVPSQVSGFSTSTERSSRSLFADKFGLPAEIIALEPGTASYLFDYGSDTRENRLQVLHIHGRIRKPESWLVLSESDYRARYAREDDGMTHTDDAMRLIFNANPLLFLGLGMEESDILRPLRTYSEEEVNLSDRPAVALLPRTDNEENLRARQDKAMSSYGIFHLYYGCAKIRRKAITSTGTEDVYSNDDDCLNSLWKQLCRLSDLIARPADKPKKFKSEAKAIADALRAYASEREDEGPSPDPHMAGMRSRRFTIVDVEGSKQHAIEVRSIVDLLFELADALQATARTGDLLDDNHDALKIFLEGLKTSLLTNFFCARLRRSVHDAVTWEQAWATPSYPKEPFGRTRDEYDKPLISPAGEAYTSTRQVMMLRDLEAEKAVRRAVSQGECIAAAWMNLNSRDGSLWQTYQAARITFLDKLPGQMRKAIEDQEGEARTLQTTQGAKSTARALQWLKVYHREVEVVAEASLAGKALRDALNLAWNAYTSARRLLGKTYPLHEVGADEAGVSECLRLFMEAPPHDAIKLMIGHEPVAPVTDRFFAGNPSPALIALRSALHNSSTYLTTVSRRILVLTGGRGSGRGHLFAAFRSPKRFAHICSWLNTIPPHPGKFENNAEAAFATARIPRAFYNFGLSHEVVSIFDRLIAFLHNIIIKSIPDEALTAFMTEIRKLQSDRIARLEYIMDYMSRKSRLGTCERIVICIINIGVLFNEDGGAKNSQVGRLFRILVSPLYKAAPVDLIFFMDAGPLPRPLAELSDNDPFLALCADLTSESYRSDHVRYMNSLGIQWQNEVLQPGAKSLNPPRATGPSIFVHKIHPMLPATFVLRFFPKVAAALFYLGWKTKGGKRSLNSEKQESLVNYTYNQDPAFVEAFLPTDAFTATDDDWSLAQSMAKHFADANNLEESPGSDDGKYKQFNSYDISSMQLKMRDSFDSILSNKTDLEIQNYVRVFLNNKIEMISLKIIDSRLESAAKNKSVRDSISKARKIGSRAEREAAIREFLKRYPLKLDDIFEQALASDTPIVADSAEKSHYFSHLCRLAGSNRFCLTVLVAAIDDMIERRLDSFPCGLAELGPVIQFIERLDLATAGQTAEVRQETIVAQVLLNYKTDLYNSYNSSMSAWPQAFTSAHPDSQSFFDCTDSKTVYELQECILVNLSLIGQPVTASALLGIRDIALKFSLLFDGHHTFPMSSGDKITKINIFMDLMVYRCLIFRLYPKNRPESDEYYFTVHGLVRRYFLSQMNTPNVDYSKVDQLTVSMYATQPSDLPKPTAEGNRRIRHVIEGLSQFENLPPHPYDDPYLEGVSKEEKRRIERIRLRASFGALRSFYSVGVISRFSTYVDEGLPTPEGGYFEAHRRRVRWLVRKAVQLDGPWQLENIPREDHLSTFYAEELAWMFNECGVLSLAQGRVDEADRLLARALETTETFIECRGWGSLHVRIGLNIAVTDIERGRFKEAYERLQRIARDDETQPIILIAESYMAQIHAIRGDYIRAIGIYDRAISGLVESKRYRAAAICMVHKAEAILHMAPNNFSSAQAAIMDAQNTAANGGHEDVRQLSVLCETWLNIMRTSGNCTKADKEAIHASLRQTDRYASVTGVPYLKSRASLIEAQFLIAGGEYLRAVDSAQEAMMLATRHGLELVKISAMRVLGSAMAKLNLDDAKGLLVTARELAYSIGYNSEFNRIEQELAELI